jgi:histidyl-tRNA synthetase
MIKNTSALAEDFYLKSQHLYINHYIYITMVMQTIQIRLTRGLVEEIKKLVDRGIYPNSSECVRDAVRRLITGAGGKMEVPKEAVKVQEKIQEEIKEKLQRAKGTRDFLPENQIIREEIINVLRETFELFGYSPLETPILERFDILSAKYAGGAEILKETFKLKDQGGRELGLRYDLTVPLARVVGMNPQLKMPFKRYQVGEVFRDGPISLGRYRQFIQCDADIIGCKEITADAECINMVSTAFKKLGFDIEVKLNNRKILNKLLETLGVDKEKIDTVILSIDKLEKFGKEAVADELREKGIADKTVNSIMEAITIVGSDKEKLRKLKRIIGDCEGFDETKELIELLNIQKIDFILDVSLSRGLTYYTGTIFETFIKNSSIKSSVCSGGRWDKMIGQFLGKGEYPAIGISFGVDRIYDAVVEKEKPKIKTVTSVFVIPVGKTREECIKICEETRKARINTDMDLVGRGISKNLNYANSLGIPFVLFVGEDELKQNKVKLKDMESGKEQLISLKSAIAQIRKNISRLFYT